VLPFKFTGANTEVAALAEGLSEEIVTGLSRFSYLRVISRGSTLRYASATDDVRAVGKTLGARYVMEGSLRLAGSTLRVAVQLVDASTGAHLWAETYDRPLRAEDIFALQDDLAPRIVSTVADQYGALVHSMSESLRGRSATQYSAHEAMLRLFGYLERMTPEEHSEVRGILEAAVAAAPGHSGCHAALSAIYWQEYANGYNVRPDPLGRAHAAARQAVAVGPTNHLAHSNLATVLFFQKDFLAFRPVAERGLALNTMDTSTTALLGSLIAYAGDWEYGLDVLERAAQLNPHHPGWYHFPAFHYAYHRQDYRGALASALKFNMPGYFFTHAALAAVYGQLGEKERARAALRELHALIPNFGALARQEFGKWLNATLTEHLIDGLRKAGLEIADEQSTSTSSSVRMVSSESRAAEGFWIAVLPFKFTGTQELGALAEGLSEEISTGLSRFSYLRVIARSSTSRYASETSDIRTVGQALSARYVMEGSLRQVGSMLRVSVQLVDASTGAQLWAETYDRQFHAEEIFALQDDLVPRIVSTVADINGVLPRSMSEAVCNRSPDELSPYEAVLRSFRYFDRVTPEELAAARSCLQLAVEKAPTYADAWAMLALLCVQDYAQGFNLQLDSLTNGTMAAQRAVEAAPSNHLAYFSLAQACFFQKELESFRNAAERAVALNPMDGNSLAFMGELLTYTGDWERGLALASRAKQINPNHPGWFWYANYFYAYRQGDYREALSLVRKANLPGHWGMHAGIAAAAGQLGDHEAAGKAVRDLLKLRPDFCTTIHLELRKWFDPELREHIIDGLRKAGLEIAGEEPGVHHVSGEKRADEGFWIAVLPFKAVGLSTELETLALGMTEEIVTGFSRFSYLRVMALGSTLKHSQSGDLRQIGAELGARYVMEGSIRQAGSTVRLAVQLVDASNGAHLWAETFDRHFQPDQIFAMQDELIPRIVSTCADHFGVLARSISDAIRGKESSQLSPYEALMRGFGYHYRLNAEEHAQARNILEQAIKDAPNNADCWAMLSWVYSHEYGHGFNTQPGSLDRALAAARRAVDLAPTNHLAYQTLAVALFFRKERANCLSAAERAMALNPLDASNEAIFLITFVDDWERGCSLIRRAMDLNPYVPGWYRLILALNEYRKGNYREAVDETVKANVPGIWTDIVLSAAHAQLGEQAAARNALKNLIAENSTESARELLTKWFDAEIVDNLVEGLCKAGLEIAADKGMPEPLRAQRYVESGEATEEAGRTSDTSLVNATPKPIAASSFESRPAIAVLPFVNISSEPDNEYFCDGLAEELLNALSKIESLQVAARTSAFYFKGKQANISEIGSRLNVSTVLEGSVRKSGDHVRISVQLVNVADGYHLWSEKYDRQLEDIFDIQDEIALAIVDALKLKLLGADQQVVKRYTDNTEAYQLYLKGRFFVNQRTSESLLKAIDYFNQAIELDTNYALGYAGLADAYMVLGVPDAVTEALSPRESLTKARAAAEKALQIDTSVGEVYAALAHIKWKERDWAGAESDYQRSIELNPHNPIAHFYYAVCLAGLGRQQQAIKEIRRAQELDPLSLPVNASVVYVLYLCRQYDEAIEAGKKTVELDAAFPLTHQRLGLPYVQKKMYSEAINEFQQAVNNSNRAPQPLVSLGHAYAVSGNKVEAQKVLAELKDLSQGSYVSPYGVAAIYVGLGEKGQAFDWLEKAFHEDSTELTFLKVDPRLDPLRDDPRFQELLYRAGFPQ